MNEVKHWPDNIVPGTRYSIADSSKGGPNGVLIQPHKPRANDITDQQIQPAKEDPDRPESNINGRLDAVEHWLNNTRVEP